jgi:hypothetical protein
MNSSSQACPEGEGADNCSHTSSYRDHFWEPVYKKACWTRLPISSRRTLFQTSWTDLLQSCLVHRCITSWHTAQNINLKERQGQGETPVRRNSMQTGNQREEHRALTHWTERKPTPFHNMEEIWTIYVCIHIYNLFLFFSFSFLLLLLIYFFHCWNFNWLSILSF